MELRLSENLKVLVTEYWQSSLGPWQWQLPSRSWLLSAQCIAMVSARYAITYKNSLVFRMLIQLDLFSRSGWATMDIYQRNDYNCICTHASLHAILITNTYNYRMSINCGDYNERNARLWQHGGALFCFCESKVIQCKVVQCITQYSKVQYSAM